MGFSGTNLLVSLKPGAPLLFSFVCAHLLFSFVCPISLLSIDNEALLLDLYTDSLGTNVTRGQGGIVLIYITLSHFLPIR